MSIVIKRVYDKPNKSDGKRILVDRLWPRGVSKESANLDLWLKEIAPSTDLRKWFGHDPNKWHEFEKRYKEELDNKRELTLKLKDLEKKYIQITLLYGAKDTEHNEAVILQEMLKRQ